MGLVFSKDYRHKGNKIVIISYQFLQKSNLKLKSIYKAK
jgi:hypothetical protein